MKAKYFYLVSLFLCIQISYSQVGIGTSSPDPSSELEVSSPLNDKGVLIPRMNQAQRNLIASPATSLLIYQTDNTPGFYYYNGTIWVGITAGASTDWTLIGNGGTTSATNFIGTTDDVDFVIKRKGVQAGFIGNPVGATPTTVDRKNTSFGANSLLTPAGGYRNTAIGTNALTVNNTGLRNVAIGNESLAKNTSGNTNIAVGDVSMFENLTGNGNTAVGTGSLYSNTAGTNNTAIGRNALTASTASFNTALGDRAMEFNTTGNNNVATGNNALNKNVGGNFNTANGVQALRANQAGNNNTALGYQSLSGNPGVTANVSTFSNSTAVGYQSFYNNLTGSGNVGLGNQAGYNESTGDKLYIENSNADANNALIYGEFTTGAKILRTNSTFQIGNPAVTGYAFPTTRPVTVAGQVLQYNAAGALTFQAPATALNSYAWLTTGNSGMLAASNYIGTTDANPLIFKTTAVERMRIIPTTGEVVVGSTTAVSGDKFSVYATGTNFAASGYSTLTGVGVFGNNTGTGAGVFGQSVTTGAGVFGTNSATGLGVIGTNTGTGVGVEGDSTSTGTGVFGFNDSTGRGVFGNNTSTGIGVEGDSTTTGTGVFGFNDGTGRGVTGLNTSTGLAIFGNNTGGGVGVQGQSTLTGVGVVGFNSGTGVGVQGQSVSTGLGVFGINTATGSGVRGLSASTGNGVFGSNTATGIGVRGQSVSTGVGVIGFNSATGVGVQGQSVTTGVGVLGFNTGAGAGVQGQNSSTGPAVVGFNTGTTGVGVLGQTAAGSTSFAVFANGNMGASGTKTFYIDHPNDPENKYLRHFAIESNEVLNVYRGNVVLDTNGEATVSLPDYFNDVNINFSYNLTSIGSRSEVFIKDEISNNQFKIAGGNPNQKISWQVYAERNDMYLQKYPENKTVEVDKKINEKGKYLMPELYNQAKEKGIFNQINNTTSKVALEESNVEQKVLTADSTVSKQNSFKPQSQKFDTNFKQRPDKKKIQSE